MAFENDCDGFGLGKERDAGCWLLAAVCWRLLDGLKMTVVMLRMESIASKMLAGLDEW